MLYLERVGVGRRPEAMGCCQCVWGLWNPSSGEVHSPLHFLCVSVGACKMCVWPSGQLDEGRCCLKGSYTGSALGILVTSPIGENG